MRDMMTLRQGLEIMQSAPGGEVETPSFQQAVQPPQAPFPTNTSPLRGGFAGSSPRNSLIRRPSPIYVDADSNT